MKVLIGIGAAVLLLAAYLFWPSAAITNYPPYNSTIVAFGDSLVVGVGSKQGNGFVDQLSLRLNRPIINLGRSGDTTVNGLTRLGSVVEAEPGIVILLLGGNDYIKKVDQATTRTNLASLIEAFQDNGSVVVLLGVRGGILKDNFASMYQELSDTYGTVYVENVLQGLLGRPEYMADAIHPNEAGYAIIADRLEEAFEQYDL